MFLTSFKDRARYPTNLVDSGAEHHELKNYRHQLDKRESDLFETDLEEVAIDLCEHDAVDQRYRPRTLRNQRALEEALPSSGPQSRKDPCNTFMFWHAPSSRDPLRLTKEMAYTALSFFQVKPFFLDFLFLFGLKVYPDESHFSSFRHSPLFSRKLEEPLPAFGRSEKSLELCYNLQGVEPDPDSTGRPWSVRHTVVYHRLDLATGACFWLIMKGNELMKDRIQEQKRSQEPAWKIPSQGISNCLDVHYWVSKWCVENWRWYLDYLEECLNKISRPGKEVGVMPFQRHEGSCTSLKTLDHSHKKAWTWRTWSWSPSTLRTPGSRDVGDMDLDERGAIPCATNRLKPSRSRFKFVDLQRVQDVEEKANQALLAIQGDLKIIGKLECYYQSLVKLRDMPAEVKSSAQINEDVVSFIEKLDALKSDLDMHRTRSASLLRLVANRKTLLTDILEYNNSEITKASALSTERLTRKMNALTSRTKQETVMMRVISLVTVVFLPGTFISTLMSTDIVRFPDGRDGLKNGLVSNGAIFLYLALTLPLTAGTLVAWYLCYLYVKRDKKETSIA